MLFSSQACVGTGHIKSYHLMGQHLPCSWDDLYNQLQFKGCLYKMNHLTCGFYLGTPKLAQRRNVHVEIRRSVWHPPKKRCLQKLTVRIGHETKRYKILISKKQWINVSGASTASSICVFLCTLWLVDMLISHFKKNSIPKSNSCMAIVGESKASETKIPVKRCQGSGGASSQRLSRWQSNLGTSAAAHGKIGWWIPEGGWWECIYTYIYIYTYTCIYIYIYLCIGSTPHPLTVGFFSG